MGTDRGIRVVLTREREQNRAWARRLAAGGIEVLDLPMVRFEILPPPYDLGDGGPDGTGFDWILFTSPQGVRAFVEAGLESGGARCAALGAGTSAAMAACGLRDELGLEMRDGVEFVGRFLELAPRPGRVLLPGPRRRMTAPLEMLADRGVDARAVALYETQPVPARDLPADPFGPDDVVFFCSPSAVRAFTGAYAQRPRCVAIGETTAQAAREAGFDPAVAASPDLDAMAAAAGLATLPPTPETECSS